MTTVEQDELRSEVLSFVIFWRSGIFNPGHCSELNQQSAERVPATLQIHLRHLVGGRARSYTGELPHERIFQVDFPERPGALRKFLGVFSPDFLLTLFHYRKTGEF